MTVYNNTNRRLSNQIAPKEQIVVCIHQSFLKGGNSHSASLTMSGNSYTVNHNQTWDHVRDPNIDVSQPKIYIYWRILTSQLVESGTDKFYKKKSQSPYGGRKNQTVRIVSLWWGNEFHIHAIPNPIQETDHKLP